MGITASQVKELRERTGAGMMECKKALVETNGDIEAAITAMRKSGQAKAAKLASKVAAEGAIVMEANADNNQAVMLEVNSQTDFVASDDNFKEFAKTVAVRSLEAGVAEVDAIMALPASEGSSETLEQLRENLINKIRENIQLRRAALVESTGVVGSYQHGDRIGVLVAINTDNAELAREVAMHIAAVNPRAINKDALDPELVAKEREIFIAQAKASGKPDDIAEKMVTGRLAKFAKEVCLVDQPFVKDPDQTVGALLKAANAEVTAFVRFEVGEGIEVETVDFAEEVKAQVQGSE